MVTWPGGTEPVPRADTRSSRSELLLCPLPPTRSSSPEEAGLAVGRKRCGAWGSSRRAREGANREQEGGLQCLGAKFSSALFWVTTFTTFLHPESFRLPARLRCFQLMGFHTSLTTGLVQGLPSSPTAALQSPHCWAGCPTAWGGQIAKLGLRPPTPPPAWLVGRRSWEWHRSWERSRVVTGKCQGSGVEVCRQLTCISVLYFLWQYKLLRGKNAW